MQQGENDYLLADPRLAEAHNDITVVPPTGTDRSAPQHLPGANLPHAQHRSGEGEGGRKRAASDTGSSTSSSRSGTSIKATLKRRRRQSGRHDDTLQANTKGTEYGSGVDFHKAETKDTGVKDSEKQN